MGAYFCKKSEKASNLIFVLLNFVIATSPGAWHCTSDYVIDARARSWSLSFLLLSHTLDKQHEIEFLF